MAVSNRGSDQPRCDDCLRPPSPRGQFSRVADIPLSAAWWALEVDVLDLGAAAFTGAKACVRSEPDAKGVRIGRCRSRELRPGPTSEREDAAASSFRRLLRLDALNQAPGEFEGLRCLDQRGLGLGHSSHGRDEVRSPVPATSRTPARGVRRCVLDRQCPAPGTVYLGRVPGEPLEPTRPVPQA